MAIARGAGTEIIRCAMFEEITNTSRSVIIGEQHHIYTVLNITFFSVGWTSGTNVLFEIKGYDSNGGTTNRTHNMNLWEPSKAYETFVWDNKFSFNGTEPTNFTGPMDDVTKQNAIADQATSTSQHLKVVTSASGLRVNCIISYIDQNNA
jgi:enamine deaminase RidA (YjgF/YER057c/UK114 family)